MCRRSVNVHTTSPSFLPRMPSHWADRLSSLSESSPLLAPVAPQLRTSMPPRTVREHGKKSTASASLTGVQARFLLEAARAVSGTLPSLSCQLGRSCLSIAQIEARSLPRGAAQSICFKCGSPALHDSPTRCARVALPCPGSCLAAPPQLTAITTKMHLSLYGQAGSKAASCSAEAAG